MATSLLMGLASGLASALLFYSAARGGVLLMLLLLILTPLPVLIAGFGWGVAAVVAAIIAGAVAMSAAGGAMLGFWFAVVLGLPALWITWLVEAGRARGDAVEWYPAGHMVAAMATLGGLLPVAISIPLGGTFAGLKPQLLPAVKQLAERIATQMNGPPATDERVGLLADVMIDALPATIAAYWMLLFAINVYLAGRVARASGRLVRPWPDLHALTPPAWLSLILAAAMILSMLGGFPRLVGTSFAGALLVGYALLGLSVLHAIAKGRVPWLLWLAYAGLFNPVGPYVLILVALVGLIEPLLGLRERFRKPPPTAPA